MDPLILEIRCGTLQCFLDRIYKTDSESEKLQTAAEASRIAERILALTPPASFGPEDYNKIQMNLEDFSIFVFCDALEAAQKALNNVLKISQPWF